jgi:glycosyltransferase involved in cell wall biosynthesis
MALPRISVVVPSFNHAHYLPSTLDSLLAQDYPNLEIILIDGGSTDGSVEIIRKYAAHLSYWVSEPDDGQTHALIKGFARATGEVFCWLNSDDLFEPWTLREVGTWFETHPSAGAVFGDTIWIDAEGRELRPQREMPFVRFVWMYTFNYIPGMSTFWRREFHLAAGGLNPYFNLAMDADLFVRIADLTKIHHVSRIWSRSRFYPSQKNSRLRADSDRENLEIRARYWNGAKPPLYGLRRGAAYALRIAWKASTGCYAWGHQRDLRRLLRNR